MHLPGENDLLEYPDAAPVPIKEKVVNGIPSFAAESDFVRPVGLAPKTGIPPQRSGLQLAVSVRVPWPAKASKSFDGFKGQRVISRANPRVDSLCRTENLTHQLHLLGTLLDVLLVDANRICPKVVDSLMEFLYLGLRMTFLTKQEANNSHD